ncbi:LysR family transcriptional regulator ArgP [Herbiconiux sp. 11R-BC]|uniref:LysR family transcriptional regulator ArgP n=1 Tax=Herbiconiux sp. 11R-BC TaxID=3111637 RepID=UPI003C0C3521
MSLDLDLAQLAALRAAVSEGTFEAAARSLHITPSAISQRIKALEATVGRVLLQRSRPVVPTESGRALLSLAHQIEVLSADLVHTLNLESGDDPAADPASPLRPAHRIPMPLAVNADSLATWILPALSRLGDRIAFELHREDQAHTTSLLREGTVMAAITGEAAPVQGCSSTLLGAMRYRAVATRDFVADWFPDGVTAEALGRAPVVVFDRRDDLQDAFLRGKGASPGAARHFVPSSSDFVSAVRLGFGWGMVPDLQRDGAPELVELGPDGIIDVPLYWQQWQLRTPSLELVAAALKHAAADSLR